VSETAILILEFIFSPYQNQVFVSTEDAASGIFLPDMERVRERKRNIGFQSNF
jgi:hypothetical protein